MAGLLAEPLFARDLPVLLGQEQPSSSLAASGAIEALIERHGFTGYGEGFRRRDGCLSRINRDFELVCDTGPLWDAVAG